MTDSRLLAMARALDDDTLSWRVAAAMSLTAQYKIEATNQSVEGMAMANWVIDNPMTPVRLMNAMVATNGDVAAAVNVDSNGTVSTSDVTDDMIRYVVDAKWEAVARKMFPPATA